MGFYNLQPIFAGEPFNIIVAYQVVKHTCNPGSSVDTSTANGVAIYDPIVAGDCGTVTVNQAYRVERIRVHIRPSGDPSNVCSGTSPTTKLYLMARNGTGPKDAAIIQEKLIPATTGGFSTSLGFAEFVFDGGLVLRNCVSLYLAQSNSSSIDMQFDVYGELSSLDFIDYGI